MAAALIVALAVLGLRSYAPTSTVDENSVASSIPIKPAGPGGVQNAPRCFPLRNVGIAESAEHYYASCETEQRIKARANAVDE